MATNTTNYNLLKPTVSGDSGVWGNYINQTIQDLDDLLGGTNSKVITGIDINSGTIDNAPIGAATPNTGAFTSVAVDNITVDGQQITSTNTNGNIQLFANGTGYVELYGNTNAGAIRFNCESNSHGITIKGAPHSATATYSLELPNALGTSGQVLSLSNGSGKLAFTTISATTLSDLGITATASEINTLDGIPASLTATELGYVDGVTSGIQTQLNAKAQNPVIKSGNYTAVSGDFIVVSAGSITITLPSGPSAGDVVKVKDGTGAAETTNFTVARNSSNIASSASDLTFDKNFAEITMTYINGTIGWSV